MPGIGILVLTYNEENNIRDCLSSVDWADEIVVIDSYSTDNTLEICQEFTEKVYKREFDNFSFQRNYGLDKIESDWVLAVDADERVTVELRDEILEILIAPDKIAYEIPRKNYFLGKWIKYCGWYPDYTLRLFQNKGVSFSGLVHEGINLEGETEKLNHDLIHYTYDNLYHYLEKINQYTSLSAEDMFHKGKNKGLAYILIRPFVEFIKKYILKKGFLLGKQGLFLSIISAFYQFLRYIKLWEKNNL